MRTNKILVAMVASIAVASLVAIELSTNAFSKVDLSLEPVREPYPDADVVIRDYNTPPESQFDIFLEGNDLAIQRGKSQVVNIRIESQDERALTIKLELNRKDSGMASVNIPEGISHRFDTETVALTPIGTPGSVANVKLTLIAAMSAPTGSFDLEVAAWNLDTTVVSEKDPSKSIDVWSGRVSPLKLSITE
ncbi:MAG: hypothetical protein QXU32_12855 [Nitrososphaerales archaeon]